MKRQHQRYHLSVKVPGLLLHLLYHSPESGRTAGILADIGCHNHLLPVIYRYLPIVAGLDHSPAVLGQPTV